MKTYLVKETHIGYKKVTAKSKKEAIEKANDVGFDDDDDVFGDVEITNIDNSKSIFLMNIKYQAYILNASILAQGE